MLKSVAVILVVLSTSTLIISLVNARAMSCPMSGSVFDEKTNVKSEPGQYHTLNTKNDYFALI